MNTGLKVAIGLGALGLVGGLTYYFVFRKPKSGSNELVDPSDYGKLEEIFYDNDWVADKKGIGFLVPTITKLQIGDTIKVKQYAGAKNEGYNGIWNIENITIGKKTINGKVYDSIETNAPYLGDTPVNGGRIIKQ